MQLKYYCYKMQNQKIRNKKGWHCGALSEVAVCDADMPSGNNLVWAAPVSMYLLVNVPGKAAEDGLNCGSLNLQQWVLGSWNQPDPTLAFVVIWGVTQWIDFSYISFCQNLTQSLRFNLNLIPFLPCKRK